MLLCVILHYAIQNAWKNKPYKENMLDKIIAFSIKNKLVIATMTLVLIIWGIWSASKLPIDAVPDITNNQVQIITVCPTLAGQEVEQLVTYPIEQSLANMPDLEELRSISRFGLSVITIVFRDKVDIYFARQLINEKLKEAETKIPKGVGTPELAPVSTGLGEVYQYIIHPKKGSEGKYTSMNLRTMQDWIVARQLYGTPGIAEVNSFGGQLKQYEVSVNPDRLLAMNVSIPEIFSALENNNENTGGAYIDKKPNAYFIRGVGLIGSFDDVKNIVVKSNPNGIPILIKDVAEVKFGSAVRYGAMTYNGKVDAVGGVVMMLKGSNSAEVVEKIKLKMINIQKSLPDDVTIEPFLDRTDLVKRAISTVEKNLIEGALIVIFVLVLFLGNFRAGLIVASAIPLAMLFALGLMNIFGVSANLMSLGAIDFGLIVDGAVIIVEATMHHFGLRKVASRLSQSEMDNEVFLSASKIRSSAAFGEIIILIVYIPILTLVGIEGKMFRPMAQTVSFAILGALILSLTYIPMMCALFLSKNNSHKANISDKIMALLQRIYAMALSSVIKFKTLVISVTVAMFIATVILFSRLGGEFIPNLQEGDFAFHCILPQGSSLSQSIETSMQASRLVKEFEEVKMVVGKTGSAEVPTDPMPPEATDLMIILKPRSEWKRDISYDELAVEFEHKLSTIPGVFFEKNQPIQMRFNELMTGIRQDVAVKIFGENMDTLLAHANKINEVVKQVNGATEPSVERVAGLPQIVIKYNRAQIANYGLNIEDINHLISTAFAGGVAGVVFENERKFDLVVRLDSNSRNKIEDVSGLFVPSKDGSQIPLSQVADIKMELGPAQVSREDGKRRIVVGFNVKGRDVESVVEEIQSKMDKQINLPEGYYYTFGGTFENLKAASNRLLIALPVALALIFLLLYFTFHSIKQATLIFTAIPMSAIGGVLALMARDMPFSISAGVGFIALFGVAVLNGIVLIGTFNQLEKDGISDAVERIREGTRIRLRPVLMTATVASLGFFPMAFSNGVGAEVQKPLATVVIGGLVTATFLTLFVLPLLYLIVARKFRLMKNKAIITLLAVPFLIAGNAYAQTTPKIISVENAISIVLENNKLVQAKELQVKASAQLKKTTLSLPKTSFSMQFGQYNSINQDQAFQVNQSILFPGYYTALAGLHRAELKQSQLSLEMTNAEIRSSVKYWYYRLVYLYHTGVKLTALDSMYSELVRVANLRYNTGETNMLEKTSAEARKGEINLLIQQNATEYSVAYNTLKTMMNTQENFRIADTSGYEPIHISNDLDTSLLKDNPYLKQLLQRVELAEQTKKVERAANMPDINIGYFNQSLIGVQTINGSDVYFDKSKRFQGMSVGVSIPLNIGSNIAKTRSLELQKESVQMEAENSRSTLQNQLMGLLRQYEHHFAQYNYYMTTALPNADIIRNTGKVGYSSGEITYVEYLMSLQTATDIYLKYLSSIEQLNQTAIQIQFLINQ